MAASRFLLQLNSEFIAHTKNQLDLVAALQKSKALAHPGAVRAMQLVDRALFMPSSASSATAGSTYSEPYANAPQALGFGATLSAPSHHALVLETLHACNALRPGSACLDVGTGTGYLAACFAATALQPASAAGAALRVAAGRVLATDRVPELVQIARSNLHAKCPVTSAMPPERIQVEDAYRPGTSDALLWDLEVIAEMAPYDCIHLGFALDSDGEELAALRGMLKPGSGVLVGGLRDTLCLWTADAGGRGPRVLGQALCQPVARGTFAAPEPRAVRADKVRARLDGWRLAFVARTGRRPTREDLHADLVSRELFAEFARLSR
jgi:protein-L-isoaspartate(D-aspartate) O-methyltransferase